MGTNGKEILYNPEYVKVLKKEEIAGVICHEIMHCILEHHIRRNNRDMLKWNIACDYAVNWVLKEACITMPDNLLYDYRYRDMNAEKIYDMLDDNEMQRLAKNMIGEVMDAPSGEESDQKRQWKNYVSAGKMIAEAAGTLPLGLDRIVNNILDPQLPWKEILNRFIIEKAKDDYSWKYPNTRYLHTGLYLPSLDSLTLKTIGVAIDTSGSINNNLFDQFIAELRSILSLSPTAEAEVVYVDCEVAGNDRLTQFSDKLTPKGGGGTDYVPGFKYFEDLDEEIGCIIYFTDGYCDSFPDDSIKPTLWVVYGMTEFTPPFGEVVYIQ